MNTGPTDQAVKHDKTTHRIECIRPTPTTNTMSIFSWIQWDTILLAIVLFSIPLFLIVRKAIREELPEYLTLREIECALLHMLDENVDRKPSLDQCQRFMDALIRFHSYVNERDVQYEKSKMADDCDGNDEEIEIQINDSNYLCAQEIARLCFLKFPRDDKIAITAMSLLIIVSKSGVVKERVLTEADRYGLNAPIAVARFSLDRRKNKSECKVDREQELFAAELQKKTALMLGSFSDGDSDMSTLVVDEGGLELMLDAASFFRSHQFTLKWIVWALFTICYDNFGNKAHLIRQGGISKICDLLKATLVSAESQRHGMALLFDILRNTGEQEHRSTFTVRSLAVNSGLHEVIKESIKVHGEKSPEVAFMGREILIGSGYKGDIPEYNGPDPMDLKMDNDKR